LALDRQRDLFGRTSRDAATTLVALAGLRVDQAQFEDAERFARDGLATARRVVRPGDPLIAKATAALGRVLQERGAYDKAIPVLADVVRLNESSGAAATDVAASLSALADAHYYAGHYATADSLNRRVLAMYRAAYGDRHPLVADILINLGATQFDRGNFKEAEGYDRQALDITRAFYGDDHYQTAANLTMLGRALEFENRFDEATPVLEQALAIRERVYGPVHPMVASTINELANIAVQQDRYDDAEKLFQRILAIYRTVYGDKHYLIGLATSNLGSVALARKDYTRAERLFRDAVRRYTDAQGPEHLNTGIAHVKLGRTLLRERRFQDAQVESLAGYDVLTKQASPSSGFLQNARKDLAIEYDSVGRAADAAHYRTEFVAESTKAVKR